MTGVAGRATLEVGGQQSTHRPHTPLRCAYISTPCMLVLYMALAFPLVSWSPIGLQYTCKVLMSYQLNLHMI